MAQSPVLKARDVSVTRGTRTVIQKLNLEIFQGDVMCFIGENGSGKTTLIESLVGILPLTTGQVDWFSEKGESLTIRNYSGTREKPYPFGLTLQSDGVCGEEKVMEILVTSLKVSGMDCSQIEAKKILEEWGMSHRAEDRVSQLSAGLRRRLAVISGMAPAMMCRTPRIVFLDEPSEGLDSFSKGVLKKWISELSQHGNTVVMASHDEEVISCSRRILTIDSGGISESNNTIEEDIIQERQFLNERHSKTISSLFSWTYSIERRNPVDTIGKATPAILALLLSYSVLIGMDTSQAALSNPNIGNHLAAALVLTPAFISAVISPAMIRRFSEEECGKWWSAVCGPQFRPATSIMASSILLPLPLTYLSWLVLSGSLPADSSEEVLRWLWLPSLVIIDISCAATALHLLVSDLRRSGAAVASLLLIVLIWPFMELVDALSVIMEVGMSSEISIGSPLASIIIASIISAMVWAVAVIIPDA